MLLAVLAATFAVRSIGRTWNLFERTLETSGQLAIRITVVIVFALVALASELGLDLLLGGFVAGIIVSLALKDREVTILESKLSAIGYGFLIPFFFVHTGITFDLDALLAKPLLLIGIPVFLLAFLIARGTPALVLYRHALDRRNRVALAFFTATELPLVVAITTIAVERGPHGARDGRLAGRRRRGLLRDLPAGSLETARGSDEDLPRRGRDRHTDSARNGADRNAAGPGRRVSRHKPLNKRHPRLSVQSFYPIWGRNLTRLVSFVCRFAKDTATAPSPR